MTASPPKELPLMQALWIGDELPDLAHVSIRSFTEKGHPYHLYTYRSFPDLPPGCVLKDANEILPEKCVFRRKAGGSVASFSDWFRFELLKKKGGYYVDTDIVCLKPFDFDEYFVAAYERDGLCEYEKRPVTNGAVLRTKPGNMLWRLMCLFFRYPRFFLVLRTTSRILGKLISAGRWKHWRSQWRLLREDWRLFRLGTEEFRESMGTKLSHRTYRSLVHIFAVRRKWYRVMPRHYFYPIVYQEKATLVDDTYAHTDNPFPDSYAIHFWQYGFRRRKIPPHPDSLWEQLHRKYLPER